MRDNGQGKISGFAFPHPGRYLTNNASEFDCLFLELRTCLFLLLQSTLYCFLAICSGRDTLASESPMQ